MFYVLYSVWLNVIQHMREYNTNNINQFEYEFDRLELYNNNIWKFTTQMRKY